jgi:type IX secretion system PorP/SprF family membrane protein
MKKIYFRLLFFFTLLDVSAQQLPQYAQFTLNNLAMNPAYGGTHLGLEFWAGRRNQWLGFDQAPVDTYGSFIYSWRRNFNYKAVHSIGGYFEQDRIGLFTYKAAHLYYAFHLKLSRAWKMSFGVFAGARNVSVNSNIIDKADPAYNFVKVNLYMGPDIIPGWRLYSKNLFLDVSVRQLYRNKLEQGSTKIGNNSKLIPQPVILFGYRFHSPTNDFVFVPAVKLQGAVTRLPSVDLNLITYYRRKIGLGITYRVGVSAAVMLQVRLKKNIMVAFAYEYNVNRLRYYNPNTTEVIVGFSPVMNTDDEKPSAGRVANCPVFDN